MKLHLVSETHWDREWYEPFEGFRLKLVEFFDKLLELFAADPEYRHFVLDGQSILLEDYLEIRPGKRAELERLVREGRLVVGPWYVLADEYLPSPEAHVRNMVIGTRLAREFGREMRVSYNPDQFGHISQMPQILKLFGFERVFFSRGADREALGMDFFWEAPDGSRVLARAQDYGDAARLPEDFAEAVARIEKAKEPQKRLSAGENVLLMNGSDHLLPQPHLPALIRFINDRGEDEAVHSTLDAFFDEHAPELGELKVHRGELRHDLTCGTIDLYGVLSSRMYLKQASFRASRELERWAEPFSALAALSGLEYPAAQLKYAWKLYLKNMPHDSICGCSVDRVHGQMMDRFRRVVEVAGALSRNALERLSRGKPGAGEKVCVFNPSPSGRKETVTLVLDLPEGADAKKLVFLAPDGTPARAQEVAPEVVRETGLGVFTYVQERKSRPAFFLAEADVPALGFSTLSLKKKRPSRASTDLKSGPKWAENSCVRVEFAADGSLKLHHKPTRARYGGLDMLEDDGEAGGGYHHRAPAKDNVVRSKGGRAKIKRLEAGPLRASFLVERTLRVPDGLTPDKRARTKKLLPLVARSVVSLRAGSARVDFHLRVRNECVDHRLRAVFPTRLKTDSVCADGHFDVVERPVSAGRPHPTEPQGRFVDLSDGKKGLCVINLGLPEYEVTLDAARAIRLTVLRSHSEATWEWWKNLHSPQGAMLGESVYEYSVLAHEGGWENAFAEIESRTCPMRAFQFVECSEIQGSQFRVEGPARLTAFYVQDGRVLARLYNPRAEGATCALVAGFSVEGAEKLDLCGELMEELPVSGGRVELELGPKEIATVGLGT